MTRGRREAAWVNFKEARVKQGTPFMRNPKRSRILRLQRGWFGRAVAKRWSWGGRRRGHAKGRKASPRRRSPPRFDVLRREPQNTPSVGAK